MECDVLIVGAGPTGLTPAAELRRRDVDCLLIDALDAPQHWDRATVVHPRSLEIFEALGIVDRFLAAGTPQRAARLHSAGEVLAIRPDRHLGLIAEGATLADVERYAKLVTGGT